MTMRVAKKVLKIASWSLAGLLALAFLIYATALVVNWRDQPPSAAAEELRQIYANRSAVEDGENGYVYAMGFAAPEESDPRAVGLDRVRWWRSTIAGHQPPEPEPGVSAGLVARRPEAQRLIDACKGVGPDCAVLLAENSSQLSEWLSSQEWLIERYRVLHSHAGWYETLPPDVRMPAPDYSAVFDAQVLTFARAWQSARQRDPFAVRDMLQRDLRFWREVLASADLLITKMIATVALRRHFALGNILLRELAGEDTMNSVPQAWHEELSAVERSMLRVAAGEMAFGDRLLQSMNTTDLHVLGWGDQSLADRGLTALGGRFFQPQDTSNKKAAALLAFVEAFDRPLEQYADIAARVRDGSLAALEQKPLSRLYNPVGDILNAIGHMGIYEQYAVRVGDVEGMRRAALLTTELRARGVPAERVAEDLRRAELRSPYDGSPFEWAAEEGAIVFVGLADGERGRHAYVY